MDENLSPALRREMGKSYFFSSTSSEEDKSYGLKLIFQAYSEKDPEAAYIVAKLVLDNVIKIRVDDPIEYALSLMCSAANSGCIQARAYLNSYCDDRYSDRYDDLYSADIVSDRLSDFNGKPIRINRQGLFTPIDAILEYKDGCNILTLKTDLMFLYGDEITDPRRFEDAVIKGISAWQGEYDVFGGQKLSVRIELTKDQNSFDNIWITPLTTDMASRMQSIGNAIATKDKRAQISDMVTNKRSFATTGLKWTASSRKIICIQSRNGRFDDYDEIMHVAKHEFGHALGLGDLYSSEVDFLSGVKRGTYSELDSYAVTEKYYNLVMCDHHGPISNNDIEMVVLAFRENKMQLYQPIKMKGKISSALGKGN